MLEKKFGDGLVKTLNMTKERFEGKLIKARALMAIGILGMSVFSLSLFDYMRAERDYLDIKTKEPLAFAIYDNSSENQLVIRLEMMEKQKDQSAYDIFYDVRLGLQRNRQRKNRDILCMFLSSLTALISFDIWGHYTGKDKSQITAFFTWVHEHFTI